MLKKIIWLLIILWVIHALWSGISDAHRRHKGILAIVNVSGPIQGAVQQPTWSSNDADDIADDLHKLSEDDDVKAILLRINSPGGTVGAVQEINTELQRCRAKGKKVIASMGDVAASGGYYLASGTDRIVANPGTITGSIGVILEFPNLEVLFQKIGFKLQVVKSGEHKDIGSPARALTPEEKRLLQSSIDDAYSQFLTAVSSGRHMDMTKLKAIADGRVFTGQQAMQAGLVDELGDKQDAIQVAIRLAHLPAKPYIETEEHKGFSEWLAHASSQVTGSALPSWRDVLSDAHIEYRWRP